MGTYQHRETAESVSLWRKHPFSHHDQHQLLLLHATRARLLAPDPDQRCTSLPVGWVGVRACKTGASSCLRMSSSWTVFLLTRGSAPAYGSNLIIMFMPGFWSAPTPVFFLEYVGRCSVSDTTLYLRID